MKVSKTGYKKNSKDKNEPALVIPSNKITMKGVEFPVFGTDDTGYSQMMYPGLDYSFPGSYVHELPMARNGMSAPGPSKVIGGKLEISYDKDRNIYLKAIDGADWTKIEGDRAKEFRTKFAEHMPGYFDPAGSIKQISKKAAKELGTKQQIVADKPKYQEAPQEAEPAQEVVQAPQSPLQQVAAGVPPMLAKSAAQPSFGNKVLSEIGNPEKIRQTKLQSKYQTSPDYHVTPYGSVNQANKEYEKTVDYKLRYKNVNEYSTDDIPKIQEKLYNEGYLQKPEQLDLSTFKSKDQVVELQKKLAKFGLMDMLGKSGPNKDGITGTLTKETKDAVKRFNELNQTYKSGELDDMTKQAIKNFKNSTDSKNAMGLPVVNPKELYDPETGEPYTDKTYEAMSVFENSLKSKGYFLGDQGYDISESAASNPKISFNFKLNPEPTTAFGMCAAYVNGTVCEDDVVGDEARDELGFKGSAWHISENLQNKGGQLVFAGLPDRSAVNLNGKNEITGYLKSQLTSPETTAQLKSLVGDGNLWGKNTKVRPGDVVNIFFEGSGYTEEAYNQTKSLNNKFFTTHVGIVKADDAGNLFVEHNIHGNIEKDKIQDFIDGKVKGNGKNRVSLISGITRPNYVDGVDKDAKIPVTGVSYYQTEEGKFNPRGIFANPGDYLGQTISGENTHKYLTTIEKNKDKLLKDIPISDTEFGKLMRVARVIPTLETYGGQNAEEEKTLGYKITKGLKDIVSEKSTGFTKLKDASNLGEDLRQNLYQNDDSQLTDPVKAAIPTFYLLSKNYLYLKEVANRNNIDVTADELAKLAGLSYNQSIGKVAGELVDKGSYQNYYDYRVKTASDPGGNFKYRKVMDLYDKQTMKEGGITAPGRFKNPEGNWVSKYENGGDISIPDLSRPTWLNKYQDGAQVAANLPWINQSGQYKDPTGVGPTVAKAEELKQKKLIEAARNSPSGKLPSGAITPVMGPVEYALMAPVAASSIMKATPIIGSAMNAPIAGLPGVTAGNALGAGFATDAALNRLPQIPGQLRRGEYADAAVNAVTGLLDVGTAGMLSPLYKGAKTAAQETNKYLQNKYLDVAEGSNPFNYAWKSPAERFDPDAVPMLDEAGYIVNSMPMSEEHFRKIKNLSNLTDDEKYLIKQYEKDSRPFTGRNDKIDLAKRNQLDDLLRRTEVITDEPLVMSRRIKSGNPELFNLKNGVYTPGRPTSWSAGRDAVGNESYSGGVDRMVMKLPKGKNRVLKNPYESLNADQLTKYKEELRQKGITDPESIEYHLSMFNENRPQERELLLDPYVDLKKMGKVKNSFGGYDYVMKPKFYKNGGLMSSGEGYYDYINGYSGIFAKGGPKGWLDNYK
jgi:hypothetical protein